MLIANSFWGEWGINLVASKKSTLVTTRVDSKGVKKLLQDYVEALELIAIQVRIYELVVWAANIFLSFSSSSAQRGSG